MSATVCLNDGDTHNGPNEQAEAKFPILVERFELIPDSGGAGTPSRRARHRAHHARADATSRSTPRATARTARPGASTAAATRPATRWRSALGDEWKDDFPNAKVLVAQLKPGDAFRISLGRRRRLRRAVRAAGRGRARGRAAGLCVGEGRGGALWRGGRCRDLRGRSGGDRQASRGENTRESHHV